MSNEINEAINNYIKAHQNLSNVILSEKIKETFNYEISSNAVSKRKCRLKDDEDVSDIVSKDEVIEDESGMMMDVKTKTQMPLTQEELIEKFNVDLNIWEIQDFQVGTWGDPYRPYYTIKAKFYKKDGHLFNINPVLINATFKKPVKKNSKLKTALIIPDSQNGYYRDLDSGHLDPFHDRACWDISIQIADEIQPDRIVLLGDHLDLPEWSDRFLRSPEALFITQPALYELAWWFAKLRQSSPNAEIDYLEGNHEFRLKRSIINMLPAAYKLKAVNSNDPALSIENLLDLKNLHITYHGDYPNGRLFLNENLACVHGELARGGSGDTSKALLNRYDFSLIYGHIHRQEMLSQTKPHFSKERTRKVFSPGTISRIDGQVPSKSRDVNWQQGLAVVEYEEGDGLFDITPITINQGQCIFRGRKYIGAFDVKELLKDTNYEPFSY